MDAEEQKFYQADDPELSPVILSGIMTGLNMPMTSAVGDAERYCISDQCQEDGSRRQSCIR